uniref:Uncharacterized protein n=1 Tax=Gadus morhua TaxID=8049 RepID=A0A8C5ACL3_GADMO
VSFNNLNLIPSNTHLNLESISSRKRKLTTPSISIMSGGASMDWTMNLCLLFSFGSYSKGCSITEKKGKYKS